MLTADDIAVLKNLVADSMAMPLTLDQEAHLQSELNKLAGLIGKETDLDELAGQIYQLDVNAGHIAHELERIAGSLNGLLSDKLRMAVINMPQNDLEEMIAVSHGNQLFHFVMGSSGTVAERLAGVDALWNSATVQALPADRLAKIEKLCGDARTIINEKDDTE